MKQDPLQAVETALPLLMEFWLADHGNMRKKSMKEENCRHSSLPFIEILYATVPFSILSHLNLIKVTIL